MELKLYDGTSDIEWVDGTKTREDMDGNLHYPPREQPCILMVDEKKKAHDWRYLYVLCGQYDVEFTEGLDDYQPTLDAIIEKMNKPKPTLESVDAKATEAKTTADTVQDQMDALTSAFDTEVADNA